MPGFWSLAGELYPSCSQRVHKPQLKDPTCLKILHAAAKSQYSRINKYIKIREDANRLHAMTTPCYRRGLSIPTVLEGWLFMQRPQGGPPNFTPHAHLPAVHSACSKHWKGPFVQLPDKQRLSLSITRTSCFWDSEPLTWICRDLLIGPMLCSSVSLLSSQRTWLHQAHSTVSGIQIGLNKWYSTGWMNNQRVSVL